VPLKIDSAGPPPVGRPGHMSALATPVIARAATRNINTRFTCLSSEFD